MHLGHVFLGRENPDSACFGTSALMLARYHSIECFDDGVDQPNKHDLNA